MTETQYRILLDLYHEYNEAFNTLSSEIKQLFLQRLHEGR